MAAPRSILRRRAWTTALLLAPWLVPMLACGADERPAAADANGAAAPRPLAELPAPAPAAGAASALDSAGGDGCPMRGVWRPCSVEERLESAGFRATRLDAPVRQESLGIAGTAYRVGDAELQLFLYADSVDAAREAARVEPEDASAAEARGILRPPLVLHSNNLVALLFDNNDRFRERIRLAIAAGLPRD